MSSFNSGGLVPGGGGGEGTAAPSGPAGGDLTGTYPNPTVKASVGLTGAPTAPTATAGDNTTQLATDAFVSTAVANAIAGVNPAVAVLAATTLASNTSGLTYANGVSGVGATFTGTVNTALTFDGVTLTAVGQRVLVKNDTQSPSGAFNGVYFLTVLQTAILAPVLTRAVDYDMPSDMNNTGAIPVQSGTANIATSWLLTSQVTTVGTTPLTYTVFTINPAGLAPLAGVGSQLGTIDCWAPNVGVVGSWSMQQLTNLFGTYNVTAAQNDSISFVSYIPAAGTFTFTLSCDIGPDSGIISIVIDGTTVGTIDLYGAVLTIGSPVVPSIVLASGSHTVTLLIASKNSSSSGYYARLGSFNFARTA